MPGTAAASVPWGSAAAIRLQCLCSNEYLNKAINISEHIHPNEKSTNTGETRQPHRVSAAPCSAPLAPTPTALPWTSFPPALKRHSRVSNIHEQSSGYFPNKQKHSERVKRCSAFQRGTEHSYHMLCFCLFWGLWLLGVMLTLSDKVISFQTPQGLKSFNITLFKSKKPRQPNPKARPLPGWVRGHESLSLPTTTPSLNFSGTFTWAFLGC